MITAYDTQKVGNAMVQAIVMDEIKRQKTQREMELEEENRRLRAALEMRRHRDTVVYTRFIEDADRDYYMPRTSRIGDVWWTLVGWTVMAFGALFDALGM